MTAFWAHPVVASDLGIVTLETHRGCLDLQLLGLQCQEVYILYSL